MLDGHVATNTRVEMGGTAVLTARSDKPTRRILQRALALLVGAALFFVLGALVQLMGNHSHSLSPQNYYYADAVIEGVAYWLVAAAFFLCWVSAGRSVLLKDFSLALMLAFLGATCIAVQWVFVLLDYVEEFARHGLFQQSIHHIVDASGILQFMGWGAIAASLAVTLYVITSGATQPGALGATGVQFWHRGPTRVQ